MAAADGSEEEEYIEMDMSSDGRSRSSAFLCYSILSALPPTSPRSNEFEFQMSAVPDEAEAAASHADELFYQGKLLPLHLPPRLQMVEKLLQNSKGQPLEASKEDCFSECSAALVRSRPSWSKKFNLIKQLSLSPKLKASGHYLTSLFYARPSADEPCASEQTTENLDASGRSGIRRGKQAEEEVSCHRNSFSSAINWSLVKKKKNKNSSLSSSSSSSSSSFSATSSNRFSQPLSLNRRSSNVDSDAESSIQRAITHCKKSQRTISGRKSASDIESKLSS